MNAPSDENLRQADPSQTIRAKATNIILTALRSRALTVDDGAALLCQAGIPNSQGMYKSIAWELSEDGIAYFNDEWFLELLIDKQDPLNYNESKRLPDLSPADIDILHIDRATDGRAAINSRAIASKLTSSDNHTLIYQDAEESIRLLRGDIDSLNNRLSILLGLNLVLIKFSAEIAADRLRIVAILFAAGALSAVLVGLSPKPVASIISPGHLLKERASVPLNEFMEGVIEKRDEIIQEFIAVSGFKAASLKWGLVLLGLTAAILSMNAINV